LKHLLASFQKTACWLLPQIPLFWFLRVVVYIGLGGSPVESEVNLNFIWLGCLYDGWFVLASWILVSLTQLLLYAIRLNFLSWIVSLLAFCLLAISIVTDQYYLTMFQPLDESLFYFSWSELLMIAGLEQRVNVLVILGLLLLFGTYFWSVFLVRKHLSGFISTKLVLFFALLVVLFAPKARYKDAELPAKEALVNNRAFYFIDHSLQYALEKDKRSSKVYPSDFASLEKEFYCSDPRDPFHPTWHALPESSELTKELKRTNNGKAPNIVLLIVESLSSDFVGRNAHKTGHMMPFLDSLSKQSLYFPNALSTSQRTHNVLPAVLASVPNVMDGNSFQQIAYPHHWSLMKLLQKTYYPRFYCGVYLEYLNMRGFMNYHGVKVLSEAWDKKLKEQSNQLDSPWGMPDEAIFKQSFLDESKLPAHQSKLDIFLTISTHDPFVYPNKEKFGQLVREKSARIKDIQTKEVIEQHTDELGSFAYADEQLRWFFTKWSKKHDFKNTIFVLTGDHGSELYYANKLSKYNVPLLIYSPLVKNPRTIHNIVSHLDVAPTLLNYLRLQYKVEVPSVVPFVGRELNLKKGFDTKRALVFTSTKLKTGECFMNGTALLDNGLYKVDKSMSIIKIKNDQQLQGLKKQLNLYQLFSQYCINQNRLVPIKEEKRLFGLEDWKELLSASVETKKTKNIGKFIRLAAPLVDLVKHHKVKVQFLAKFFFQSKGDVNAIGDLVLSNQFLYYIKKQEILFKAIRPVFTSKFKANAWNEVAFTVEFSPKSFEKCKGLKQLYFSIYNPNKIKHVFKNARIVIAATDKN
jgi:phosphoglycerol transferase MdoB-like AlkP superfamily enzyme